jgi:hypothetical protein
MADNWLLREFNSLWPVFLFFLVAFLLQLLIIKLALAQFSIPVSALSKALVGAHISCQGAIPWEKELFGPCFFNCHKLPNYSDRRSR